MVSTDQMAPTLKVHPRRDKSKPFRSMFLQRVDRHVTTCWTIVLDVRRTRVRGSFGGIHGLPSNKETGTSNGSSEYFIAV